MKKGEVKFRNINNSQFFPTLKKRVDTYFEDKNVSRKGNSAMVAKTILLLLMYFGPYALIMSNMFAPWQMLLLALLMGVTISGIGLAIMHDANHGAYSSNSNVNSILGFTLNLVGGNSFIWKLQHNILHHTYTNIYGIDEDLDAGIVVRFSPDAKRRTFHKLQYIYAFFLYGLVTLSWIFIKDYKKYIAYSKRGLIERNGSTNRKEFIILAISKIVCYIYMIILPLMYLDVTVGQFILGFFVMHFVAGAILSTVFQLAHTVGEVDFPIPNDSSEIENAWAIHQMETTANFANNNSLLTWYVGGLNFQIEHHLFPKVCHVHYKALSKIVKETAKEFNVPYHVQPTVMSAMVSHAKWLKGLGRVDNPKLEF